MTSVGLAHAGCSEPSRSAADRRRRSRPRARSRISLLAIASVTARGLVHARAGRQLDGEQTMRLASSAGDEARRQQIEAADRAGEEAKPASVTAMQ